MMREIIERKISKNKKISDSTYKSILIIFTSLIVFIVILSFLMIFLNGGRFFFYLNQPGLFYDFIFGSTFNPGQGLFAAGFVAVNTIWTSTLALVIALPISIFTSILITRFLPKKLSMIMFSVVAILAAIPSVIYGAFGQKWVDGLISPLINNSSSLLTIVLVIAFMIMPTITLMTITSINSTNKKIEESSIALGATKTQTSFKVTLRAAKNGVILGSLFGIGRALGEATAISMIGANMQTGPTFGLFDNTILLGPSIINATSGDNFITKEATLFTYTLSGLLLGTILIIFTLLKIAEHNYDEHTLIKNNQNEFYETQNLFNKIDSSGVESLNVKEQKKLIKLKRQKIANKRLYNYYNENKDIKVVNFRRTINSDKTYISHKRKEKTLSYILMFTFSIIGILILLGIIGFLFSSGVSYLSWDFLTSKGTISQGVYGLAIPIFGTLFTTTIALIIALPFGIMVGIYSGAYLKSDTKVSRVISLLIQIMTSIPAVVYGTLALMLFSNTIINDELKSFEPILMLSLVIMPTIIKTTEAGVKKVNNKQVEGSISLGATNFVTTRRVFIKEIIPSIVSAAVLSASIVIADSAIYLTILGSFAPASSANEWIKEGGWTLTTQMYYLASLAEKDWVQIKAIGIVIMAIILCLSIISKLLEEKMFKESAIFFSGLFLILFSIMLSFLWLFFLGLIISLIGIIIIPTFDFLNNKYAIVQRLKYTLINKGSK